MEISKVTVAEISAFGDRTKRSSRVSYLLIVGNDKGPISLSDGLRVPKLRNSNRGDCFALAQKKL